MEYAVRNRVRIVGIQSGVLEEVIHRSMQLVGSGFRGQADLTYVSAVFRRVIDDFSFYFLHRVHVDVGDWAFNPVVVVVEAVDVVTHAVFRSANVQLFGASVWWRKPGPRQRGELSPVPLLNIGHDLRVVEEVAPFDGQIAHEFVLMTSDTLASSVLTSEAALCNRRLPPPPGPWSANVHAPGGAVFQAHRRGYSIGESLRRCSPCSGRP